MLSVAEAPKINIAPIYSLPRPYGEGRNDPTTVVLDPDERFPMEDYEKPIDRRLFHREYGPYSLDIKNRSPETREQFIKVRHGKTEYLYPQAPGTTISFHGRNGEPHGAITVVNNAGVPTIVNMQPIRPVDDKKHINIPTDWRTDGLGIVHNVLKGSYPLTRILSAFGNPRFGRLSTQLLLENYDLPILDFGNLQNLSLITKTGRIISDQDQLGILSNIFHRMKSAGKDKRPKLISMMNQIMGNEVPFLWQVNPTI